jgi:uncharacterized protein YjiS (DUF1127 family)
MGEIQLSEPPPGSRPYARASHHPIGLASASAEQQQVMPRTTSAPSFWVVPQGSTFWARPGAPFRQSARSDGATGSPAVGMVHRIIAAFRSWQQCDRSWSDLRGLNDSVLKDIGLYRGDLGRGRIQPHWYTD